MNGPLSGFKNHLRKGTAFFFLPSPTRNFPVKDSRNLVQEPMVVVDRRVVAPICVTDLLNVGLIVDITPSSVPRRSPSGKPVFKTRVQRGFLGKFPASFFPTGLKGFVAFLHWSSIRRWISAHDLAVFQCLLTAPWLAWNARPPRRTLPWAWSRIYKLSPAPFHLGRIFLAY